MGGLHIQKGEEWFGERVERKMERRMEGGEDR